ncbi:MAG: sigma-70 family RNA polymerase sigma factor [Ginsengibacter sp.]
MPNSVKYTEEELVSLLKESNAEAFSYLYDSYSGALYGAILKVITDQTLAEDILQEVFVKIWNNIQTYDSSKGRLFTWMINIARNHTIDTTRSKGFKKQSKIQSSENSVDESGTHNEIRESFDAMGIRKQVNLLKEDHQQLIDLAYFNGLTQKEISEQLSIPIGTVKSRMRAAIIELKKIVFRTN